MQLFVIKFFRTLPISSLFGQLQLWEICYVCTLDMLLFGYFFHKALLLDCHCKKHRVRTPSLDCSFNGLRISKPTRCRFLYSRQASRSIPLKLGASLLDETDELETWLFDNGVPHIKGKPTSSPAGDRIFLAKTPLKAGEEVLAVPEKFWLTKQLSEKLLGFHVSDLSDEEAIATLLLVETARQKPSFWKPWIQTLPSLSELHHFLSWSLEEVKYLECSSVMEDIETMRETASFVFEELNTELFPKLLHPHYDTKYFTLEYFMWALAIVQSFGLYDLSDPFPLVLVPGLEWFTNKYFLTQEDVSREYLSISNVDMVRIGPFFKQERRLKVSAAEDLKPGERISLVYEGNVSLVDIFYRWGWRLEALEEEHLLRMGSYEISFAVSPTDQFYDDKEDILDGKKLELLQTFELRYDMSEELLERMLPFLRLVCLQGKDVFILEAVFRSEVWSHLSLPFSYDNEKSVCELVIQTCKESLERWEQVPEDFIIRGMEHSHKIREKIVLMIKWMEETILRRTIEYFEGYLGRLEQLEYYQERRLRQLDLLRPLDSSEVVGQPTSEGTRVEKSFDQFYL